ncbi:MAG: hypothetical protein ACTHKF_11590 [Candidatus Nitrosocosmicus sp.]
MIKSDENKFDYTRKLGNKFWFEFDYPFNSTFRDIGQDMDNLVGIAFNIFNEYKKNYDKINLKLDESNYKKAVNDMHENDNILRLANEQWKIMNYNLKDLENLKNAFEDFGQGILYDADHDDLRTARDSEGHPQYDPVTGNLMLFRIHKMDTNTMWKWWHSFIRAVAVLQPEEKKWFEIDRLIAYAYIIDFYVKPKQYYQFPNGIIPETDPQNPNGTGSPNAVNKAKFILSAKEFDELDKIFENVW